MTRVVVERSFEAPEDFGRVQCMENAVLWCMEQHGVRFVHTFFARDRRRMLCLYDAPDAEAVRHVQRTGGLPFDSIWAARVCDAPDAPAATARDEHIIAERTFPLPQTPENVLALLSDGGDCFDLYRVKPVRSLLSRDGLRTVCHLRGPDAESVRLASARRQIPFDRVWTASVHEPA